MENKTSETVYGKILDSDWEEKDIDEIEKEILKYKSIPRINDLNVMDIIDSSSYVYFSVCEVGIDYSGKSYIYRLADIDRDGKIIAFIQDESRPKKFANRDKLYFKDGPRSEGAVAIWEWTPEPKEEDPERDHIISVFNRMLIPIENRVIYGCKSVEEVVEHLKKGVEYEITTESIVFSVYRSKGLYSGVICNSGDFEKTEKGYRLKEDVVSLPIYEFEWDDIIRLANKKYYFQKLTGHKPCGLIQVKSQLEVVKNVITGRAVWSTFKRIGKTRSEWKIARDFLSSLDTMSIVQEVAEKLHCSEKEAIDLFKDFIHKSNSYIDGNSMEDKVLEAVIFTNAELMNHCKDLLREDWVRENEAELSAAEEKLSKTKEELIKAESELEIFLKEEKEKQESLKQEYTILKQQFDDLEVQVNEKTKLAEKVEKNVEERIQKAQNNAAAFIAEMAFVNNATVSANKGTGETSIKQGITYTPPGILDGDDIDEISTWKENLESLMYALIDAGVLKKYARQLGAFLHAAYLNNSPVLLAGPNASEIADAYAASILGTTAASIEFSGDYDHTELKTILKNCAPMVKVKNVINNNHASNIPEIICKKDSYFFVIHPFADDLQIEPKSLYSYLTPVLTEPFINDVPNGKIIGCKHVTNYKEYKRKTDIKEQLSGAKEVRITPMVKKRLQTIVHDMNEMLDIKTMDYTYYLGIMPYAYVTMQSDSIIRELQNNKGKPTGVSHEILQDIISFYGVNDG